MTERDYLSEIQECEAQALGTFSPVWEAGNRNSKIYALDHYTEDEKKKIYDAKRYPYRIDKTGHPINTLLGQQRDARFDIFFYERENNDALRVELLNSTWKYFADLYDVIHVESDVFQDGIISKYGVFGIKMDYSQYIGGNLQVFRVPFDELMWDDNSRDYTLDDAMWMSRLVYHRKDFLINKHRNNPDVQKMVKLAGTERRWNGAKTLKDRWIAENKELIAVHEYYQRGIKDIYTIYREGDSDFMPLYFATEEQAAAEIELMNADFDLKQLTGEISPQEPKPNLTVEPYGVHIINKSEAVVNGLISNQEEFAPNVFPYSVYFPYYHDGNFFSAVDRLKDQQIWLNKTYMGIDHWFNTMGKDLLILDPRTSDAEEKMVKDNWGRTSAAIKLKHKPEIVEARGPHPGLFSLTDRISVSMEEEMGGANQLGLKQTASESGRAVLARLAQAGLDNFVPLDNMRRTKQTLGKLIAWYLTHEVTAPRIMRIVGDNLAMQALQNGNLQKWFTKGSRPNVGYLEVNTSEENSLYGLEIDVVVDEATHSTTQNWATLNALTDAAKGGVLPPMPPQVAIELIPGIPASIKQVWIDAISNPPKEPPKISTNYKDLPLDAKQAYLEQIGLPAQAIEIAMKEAVDNPHVIKPELTAKEKSAAGKKE